MSCKTEVIILEQEVVFDPSEVKALRDDKVVVEEQLSVRCWLS